MHKIHLPSKEIVKVETTQHLVNDNWPWQRFNGSAHREISAFITKRNHVLQPTEKHYKVQNNARWLATSVVFN